MNALDLYLLGRRLMKIGEAAMRGSSASPLSASVRLIVEDIFIHPDSSISEITERTALPQSHVSVSVARLRDLGAVETRADPADARRTLVRVPVEVRIRVDRLGAVAVDDVLAEALGISSSEQQASIMATLEVLATRLLKDRARPGQPVPAGNGRPPSDG